MAKKKPPPEPEPSPPKPSMRQFDIYSRAMLLGSCLSDLFSLGLKEHEVREVIGDSIRVMEEQAALEVLELGSGAPAVVTNSLDRPKNGPAPPPEELRDMSEADLRLLRIRTAAAMCAAEIVKHGSLTPKELRELYEQWLTTRRFITTGNVKAAKDRTSNAKPRESVEARCRDCGRQPCDCGEEGGFWGGFG